MTWRNHLPKNQVSNEFFEWCWNESKDCGVHIPTSKGVDLICNKLLPFKEINKELQKFYDDNPRAKKIRIPNSLRFQALNLLIEISPVGLTREVLNKIFSEVLPSKHGFDKSADSIQLVNKVQQGGIVDERKKYVTSGRSETVYRIPIPIGFTSAHLSSRTGSGGSVDKSTQVESTKKYLAENFINIPSEKWQEGHRNPALPLGPQNTVWQPPSINKPYRNRFIFDERGLRICPTPTEFASRTKRYINSPESATIYLKAILRNFPELQKRLGINSDDLNKLGP